MFKLSHIHLLPLLSLAFTCSCAKDKPKADPPKVALTQPIHQKLSLETDSVVEIGIWMFTDNELENTAIADWLGKKSLHVGLRHLLEPINLIWVDFRARSKDEATQNVIGFLQSNGFDQRDGSSTGYWGYIDGKWLRQVGTTWSDQSSSYRKNNHGRLFASKRVKLADTVVYISTAAFSIENAFHDYVSFQKALEDFSVTGEWSLQFQELDIENEVRSESHSTGDHRGAKVFVLK